MQTLQGCEAIEERLVIDVGDFVIGCRVLHCTLLKSLHRMTGDLHVEFALTPDIPKTIIIIARNQPAWTRAFRALALAPDAPITARAMPPMAPTPTVAVPPAWDATGVEPPRRAFAGVAVPDFTPIHIAENGGT